MFYGFTGFTLKKRVKRREFCFLVTIILRRKNFFISFSAAIIPQLEKNHEKDFKMNEKYYSRYFLIKML